MICANHMRQIGLGFLNYETQNRRFPPSHTLAPAAHNCLTFILPQVEQSAIYQQIDFEQNWNKGPNAAAYKNHIETFRCPEAPTGRDYISDYAANTKIQPAVYNVFLKLELAKKRGLWYNMFRPDDRALPVAEIRDGLSNTLMFFEDSGRPLGFTGYEQDTSTVSGAKWADAGAFFYTHTCTGTKFINCNNHNEIYSFHTNGCFYAHADGSVQFHSQDIEPDTFFSLFTYNQGD